MDRFSSTDVQWVPSHAHRSFALICCKPLADPGICRRCLSAVDRATPSRVEFVTGGGVFAGRIAELH